MRAARQAHAKKTGEKFLPFFPLKESYAD